MIGLVLATPSDSPKVVALVVQVQVRDLGALLHHQALWVRHRVPGSQKQDAFSRRRGAADAQLTKFSSAQT